MNGEGRERRTHFRIQYPYKERPPIRVGSRKYALVDICERGFRYVAEDQSIFKVNDRIFGAISFSDGEQALVWGVIARIRGHEVIVVDAEGISFSRALKEQRFLLKKYPGFDLVARDHDS